MRPFGDSKLWKSFVQSITPPTAGKKREVDKKEQHRARYGFDGDLLRAELPIETRIRAPECKAKYEFEMTSDDGEEIPLDLAALKPTSENFAAVVAECSRLRNDKKRLHNMLYKLDTELEDVVCHCENVVVESNNRFKKAISSLKHMDKSMRALRKDSSRQAQQLAEVTTERNGLRHRLESAMSELKTLRSCSRTWARDTGMVARVQEAMLTPRRSVSCR